MIAVIIAAAHETRMYGLDEHLPVPLFPLADRPILHHIVDYLAEQGIRRFEFVLGHLPEKIEAYLGDGARWGASFTFHLLPETAEPLHLAETIAAGLDDSILLGRGDRLVEFQLASAIGPTLYVTEDGTWTGWAILPRDAGLFPKLDLYASGKTKEIHNAFSKSVVERELSFESAAQLLQSQHDLLAGIFSGTTIATRQAEPGVWISRNVSLHPTAKLEAPLFIGPNCKISMGVRVGPSVVIGAGCIVDEHTRIANALVAAGTYVGQGLELDQVIVDRNRVVNTRLETVFKVSDSFLLSGLGRQKKPNLLHGLLSRIGALALLVLPFPIASLTFIYLLLGGKGELSKERAVRLPASYDPPLWSECHYFRLRLHTPSLAGWWVYFVAEVWPGLVSVLMGDLFLVGVKPRSAQEIDGMSADWRSIYLSSKCGLITEAFVMFGRTPTEDELYIAEAYYSATANMWHDLKLLRLYLARLTTDSGRSPNVVLKDVPNMGSSLESAGEP
jgi:NDP-sugar pyrophosphorylase family protein